MTEIIFKSIRVISKKNNRRNFGHISLPSKAYENFKLLMAEHLYPYKGDITKPFRIHVWYSIKGKYPQDIDNACTSLLDVLQDYGVIENDSMCQEIHGYKTNNNRDWMCMIRLEEI